MLNFYFFKIGNGEVLRSWMQNVRGEQLDVAVVDVHQKVDVQLVEYHGRFINIQRHQWLQNANSEYALALLHPLAAVTLTFLQENLF